VTRSRLFVPLALALTAGCARPRPEPATACRMVQSMAQGMPRASIKDLADFARGTPAEHDADSAWAQQITAGVAGGLAAGSMAAALAVGLSTNAGAGGGDNAGRNAALGLGGVAIGLTALTVTLGYTAPWTANKAREQLTRYAEHCH